MKPINEVTLKKQILSTNSPPSDEIAFLHALLNHHLGPPDDQLPTEGKPGGRNFGPRTKAKVQKFQDVNKIDFGTKFFKDGVVGPHTWEKLLEKQQVTITVIGTPQKPPTLPGPPSLPAPSPPRFPVPTPPLIPVPKLTLNFQAQAGETVTVPTQGGAIFSQTVQLVAVLLNKNDKNVAHLEGQLGPQLNFFNTGPGVDPNSSKTDLGFTGSLVGNNLVGSGDSFTWSAAAQAALNKSLNTRSASAQGQVFAQANLSLKKNSNGDDVLQVTGQAGLFLSAEAPNDNNGNKWNITGGAVLFFGVTGTFNDFGSF